MSNGLDGMYKIQKTARISLDVSEQQALTFAAAESLQPGDVFTFEPDTKGLAGRKECLGMKTWLLWERKRRVKMAMEASGIVDLDAARSFDTLSGIVCYLVRNDAGDFALEIKRPSVGKLVIKRANGDVEAI